MLLIQTVRPSPSSRFASSCLPETSPYKAQSGYFSNTLREEEKTNDFDGDNTNEAAGYSSFELTGLSNSACSVTMSYN